MKRKWLLWAFAIVLVVSAFSASCLVSGAEGTTPTVSIHAKNLNFDNQIYLWYAVKVESAEAPAASDVGMLIWREDTATRTPATADAVLTADDEMLNVKGVDCYIFEYADLTAKQMTDTVYSQPYVIHNGTTVYGTIEEYSICTYAARKLGLVEGVAGTTDENLRAMLQDMLHYGAKAQVYLKYKTERLATDILERINVTYNINMDEDSVDNPNPATFEVGSGTVKLLPLSAKGYTFMGWYADDDWENPVTEIDTSKAASITLHAMWKRNIYAITYENTLGMLNEGNPSEYTVEDAITFLPLSKYDYTFDGWSIKGENNEYTKIEEIPAGTTGNITLRADWTLKREFEGFNYVIDENYNIDNNGTKFCMLTGVIDSTATKVEISSVFNHIKEGALANCHWLEELSLPYLGSDYTTSNYTNVGYLFGYASNAEAEGAIPTSLRKLTVKGGAIGDYAFANLKTVAEIVLTPEVTSIGHKAFSNCANLEDLTMPLLYVNHSTRRAADEHGYVITQAEYYDLPGWVDREADSYDGKTFKLHINGGGILHAAAGDANWEKDGATIGNGFGGNLFELCKGISEVTIDNIKVIPQFTFARCSNLKKVTIGDTVQNIMSGAFWRTAIEEIVIPDTVKEMGEYWYAEYSNAPADRAFSYYSNSGRVFAQCKSLKKVVIGNGVVNIPAGMFTDCTNLEEIIIGENVRFVDCEAFLNTNDTFKVINNSTHKEWVVSGPVSARFMNQLMESENAPEKIYYGYEKFDAKRVDGFTETQIKDWHIVFYSPTDPYAGGESTDLEYWYHEDGADWYRKQYTVTPKLWEKPQS